jgi:hypothetical protein
VAAGDPRLSLAERYQDNEKYVSAVAAAANKLENARFLLDEDKDRIIKRAARDGVDLWVGNRAGAAMTKQKKKRLQVKDWKIVSTACKDATLRSRPKYLSRRRNSKGKEKTLNRSVHRYTPPPGSNSPSGGVRSV